LKINFNNKGVIGGQLHDCSIVPENYNLYLCCLFLLAHVHLKLFKHLKLLKTNVSMQVVATTSILADVVRQVAGDRVEVQSLDPTWQ
jgi:hypothetical protein